MENNFPSQTPLPTQQGNLSVQPPVMDNTISQITPPITPEEPKKFPFLKIINYVLAAIVLILGLSKFLMPLVLLNIIGIILFLTTSLLLVWKPKIGYILLILDVLLMVTPYIIFSMIGNY